MNIQNLVLDINKKCNQVVTANVGEVDSRLLKISVIDNGIPMDLTGITVYLYAKKVDGTKVFNTVKVEDAKQGIVSVEITSQVLVIEGFVKLTLLLTKDKARLASKIFTLKVDETIVDDKALESTNEFTALTDALGRVNNIDNRLNEIANKGTTVEVLERVTKEEIDRQIADGTIASLTITDGSIAPEKTTFIECSADIDKINRGLLSSDGSFYFKQVNQADYDTYNLFLLNVKDINLLKNFKISGGVVCRVQGIDNSYTVKSFKEKIESITTTGGINIGTNLLMYSGYEYKFSELDVSKYNVLAIYIGQNAKLNIYYDDIGLTLSNNIKISTDNILNKISIEKTEYLTPVYIGDLNTAIKVDFEYNKNNNIIAYNTSSKKLVCYKNLDTSLNYKCIILNLSKDMVYNFHGSNLSRCRIGVFYNKTSSNLVFGTLDNGTFADEVLYNDDTITELSFEYTSKYDNSVMVLYVGINNEVDFSISGKGLILDKYVFDDKIKITNSNMQDNSIDKKKLAFDIQSSNNGNIKIPKLNNILTSQNREISLIYEMEKATNDYVTDATGKKLDIDTDEFLELYYDKYVGVHEDGLKVVKTSLGKDQSRQYDIYEYDFIPPFYTDTILLTSGMHTYELSAHFGLAHFFEHYMKYSKESGYLSDGFEYLRKYFRIKVIPIVNPWGWNQSPKTYGNCNGVNINRNFDYLDADGNSVWDKFPVYTPSQNEWNVKGDKPFSEAESTILRDWALENRSALYWIDCHTGLDIGPWDNFIYYNTGSPLVPKILSTLSILEDRIRTKYKKSNPTKEVRIDNEGSIRLAWSESIGVPSFTLEQTPNNPLWGTNLNNESGDITEFAVTLYAYILGFLDIKVDAETWIKSLINS